MWYIHLRGLTDKKDYHTNMAYAQNKFYTSLIKQVTVFTCIYISMIAE